MRQEQRLNIEELEAQFVAEHPDIAKALELFDLSFAEYDRAVRAQRPIVTYSAASTGSAPNAKLAGSSR